MNESTFSKYSLLPEEISKIEMIEKKKFFVGSGNNEKCIRRVMNKRDWWNPINENKKAKDKIAKKVDLGIVKNLELSDFIWTQTTK